MEAKNTPFLIDTHSHLASSRFESDIAEVIQRARDNQIDHLISIACDSSDSVRCLELASEYDCVSATVGVHPLYVHEENSVESTNKIKALATENTVAAIGEIGLDYFHPAPEGYSEESWSRRQHEFFEAQLQVSVDLDLPTVIHQRDSADDVIKVLQNFPNARAVLHCFNGTSEEANTFLEMGHFLSYTGILTFPSAQAVRDVAKITPLDRIMVETDSPYLAPVPFRGKTCEPHMVKHTAAKLAEIHEISLDEMASITTRNAQTFFNDLK